MNVMGVDPSTRAVTAVLLTREKELVDWWHEELKPGKVSLPRAINALHPIARIHWEKAHHVAFERPAGKGMNGRMDIMRIEGMCLYHALNVNAYFENELGVMEFGPTEWKKLCGLPGNATKEDIWFHGVTQLGVNGGQVPDDPPQDFYDAYCIALAGINKLAE